MNGVYQLTAKCNDYKWFELPDEFSDRYGARFLLENDPILDWPGYELDAPIQQNPRKLSDYPMVTAGAIPLFSARAKQALEHPLKDDVQLLPVRWKEREYYLGRILSVVRSLDRSVAKIEWFDNQEGDMAVDIRNIRFTQDASELPALFYIFEFRGAEIYCTDKLKNAVEAAGLVGFKFEPLP